MITSNPLWSKWISKENHEMPAKHTSGTRNSRWLTGNVRHSKAAHGLRIGESFSSFKAFTRAESSQKVLVSFARAVHLFSCVELFPSLHCNFSAIPQLRNNLVAWVEFCTSSRLPQGIGSRFCFALLCQFYLTGQFVDALNFFSHPVSSCSCRKRYRELYFFPFQLGQNLILQKRTCLFLSFFCRTELIHRVNCFEQEFYSKH